MDRFNKANLSLLRERQPSLRLVAPVSHPSPLHNARRHNRMTPAVSWHQPKRTVGAEQLLAHAPPTPSSGRKSVGLNEVKRRAKQRLSLSVEDHERNEQLDAYDPDGKCIYCGYGGHPISSQRSNYLLKCTECAAAAHRLCVGPVLQASDSLDYEWLCPDCDDQCPFCLYKYGDDEKKWQHQQQRHSRTPAPLRWKYELEPAIDHRDEASESKTSAMFITYTIGDHESVTSMRLAALGARCREPCFRIRG